MTKEECAAKYNALVDMLWPNVSLNDLPNRITNLLLIELIDTLQHLPSRMASVMTDSIISTMAEHYKP